MDLTTWLAEVSRTALPLWDIVLRLRVAALLALAVGGVGLACGLGQFAVETSK